MLFENMQEKDILNKSYMINMKVKIWYMCMILKDMTLLLEGDLHCASWCWCHCSPGRPGLMSSTRDTVGTRLMLYMFVQN